MKKSAKGLIVAGVVPLLLAPALGLADAHAGETMQHEQHGEAHHGEARGEAYEHRAQAAGAEKDKFLSEQKQDQFSAENLIGQTLKTQDDEEIGEITDLLLDRDGSVAGLIVSVGDDIGGGALTGERAEREAGAATGERYERDREGQATADIGRTEGEREIGLSWDAIELEMENGEPVARANIDRQTLEQAQEFQARDEAEFGAEHMRYEQERGAQGAAGQTQDRDRTGTTTGAEQQERTGVTAGTAERERGDVQAREQEREREGVAAQREQEQERDRGAMAGAQEREMQREPGMQRERFITRQEADHFTADRLIGASVRGHDDDEIGQISDLLLDRDGNVAGVVVGVGGFLGIGERDVALSWDAIQITTDEDGEPVARVDVDQETLENAPEFEARDDGGVW